MEGALFTLIALLGLLLVSALVVESLSRLRLSWIRLIAWGRYLFSLGSKSEDWIRDANERIRW